MRTKRFVILLILFPFLLTSGFAQQYNKMKITLADGPTVLGKSGNLSTEAVTCMVGGQLQTYSLEDVKLVEAKKGSAWKWAAGSGGCCLAIGLTATAVNPNDDDVATLLGGSIIWAIGFTGAGYLAGALLDPWKNVYMGNIPVALKGMKPIVRIDPKGRPLFGFALSL